MIRNRHLALGILVLLSGVTVLRASAVLSSTLTARPVVAALREAGIKATPSEIEFVGIVPASDSAAAVRVTGWRKWTADTVWVRLMCRRPQDCLPFFILLHPSTAGTAPALSLQAADSAAVLAGKRRVPALVQAGSPAILLMRSGAANIRTSVICLDSGDRGSRIRVRNVVTKRILAAQIVDRGLVQTWY